MVSGLFKSVLVMIGIMALWGSAYAQRVAIFDFDDRLDEPHTVAKYIEKRLTQQIEEIHIDQFSGRSDEALAVHLLSDLDEQGYDLIITITSDALIVAHHTVIRTPLLYTNVNNPLYLGFRTLGPPGGNISGASYYVPIERQLKAFQVIQPDLKRPGFVFDRFNKSRQVELPESRDACRKLGLEFEFVLVNHKGELREQVQNLIAMGVDAIIATSSGTIYENIAQFIDLCDTAGIPVYSFNKEGVAHGAVAALASEFYRIADELLVPMALKVLNEGISPGQMPVAFLNESRMILNRDRIRELKLHLPPETTRADNDPKP